MKKTVRILALLLVAVMLFAVVGCGSEPTTSTYREEYWEEVEGDDTGDDNTDVSADDKGNSSTMVESNEKGDTVFSTTGTAKQKWINLFGQKYVSERENYEKTNKPYDVPANLKGTTVKFVSWVDPREDIQKYVVANFEKTTGIKFEWVQIPQNEYLKRISASVGAGNAPGDVIFENNDSYASLMQVMQPLNKIKSFDMKDPIWDDKFFEMSTYNGNTYHCQTLYGIDNGVNYIYYNEKVLKENGITTPGEYYEAGKWNWAALTKVAREFKALNSSYSGANLQYVKYMLLADGTEFMVLRNGKMASGLNDAAFRKSAENYYELKEAGLLGGGWSDLVKGTLAMIASDGNGLRTRGTMKGMDASHIKAVPVPGTNGVQNISAWYRAYGVCKGAPNAEGAGYFIRYLLDPYNYDWDDVFLNEESKKLYASMGDPSLNRVYGFGNSGTRGILGATDWEGIYAWENAINRGTSGTLSTTIDTLKSQVDSCVKKTNEILAGL